MNATPPQKNRWYVVANKSDGGRCLVEANNKAQAFRRVAEYYCYAEPATVADTIDMIRNACDVISAPSTPEQMDIEDVDPPRTAETIRAVADLTGDRVIASSKASDVFANLPVGDSNEK